MYRKNKHKSYKIGKGNAYEAETIEQKVDRITNNNEPIEDGAPLIYTERKNGVEAGFNIRTDRFEVAVEAMDKIYNENIKKRKERTEIGQKAMEGMKKESESAKNQDIPGGKPADTD